MLALQLSLSRKSGNILSSIKTTYEIEENNSLAFLDVLVTRAENFCTSLYRKPTFSGLYSNFESFMPISYKKGSFIPFFAEHSFFVVTGTNFTQRFVF